jgi:hypothetical protein
MAKGFQKGHKGLKPKGSKSYRTIEWENFGKELLEKGMPRALEIMDTCEDDKFMNHFTGLLEYFKPKLARVDNLQLPENTTPLTKIEIVDSTKS